MDNLTDKIRKFGELSYEAGVYENDSSFVEKADLAADCFKEILQSLPESSASLYVPRGGRSLKTIMHAVIRDNHGAQWVDAETLANTFQEAKNKGRVIDDRFPAASRAYPIIEIGRFELVKIKNQKEI